MALGSTKSLVKMSTRNIPGGKGRPVRKADNLPQYCAIVKKSGSLNFLGLHGLLWESFYNAY